MSAAAAKIDFNELGGPVFVGRDRGEAVRAKHKVSELDVTPGVVRVIIPEATYAVNSSFFLGLFGDSVKALGSRQAFLEKYQFDCPKRFWPEIESCIERALFEHDELMPN